MISNQALSHIPTLVDPLRGQPRDEGGIYYVKATIFPPLDAIELCIEIIPPKNSKVLQLSADQVASKTCRRK